MEDRILVKDLVESLNYTILSGNDFVNKRIVTHGLLIPGIELTGFIDYYDETFAIIFTQKEISYLKLVGHDKTKEILTKLLTKKTPFVVLCDAQEELPAIHEIAELNDIPVLESKNGGMEALNELFVCLNDNLAKKVMIHGTLLSIYGKGVLLRGESGIGKSEIALELIKRGHKLVADDAVITFKEANYLYGMSTKHQRNLMELRGIGLIDIHRLFGLSGVLERSQIDYIINLVDYKDFEAGDRVFDTINKETINDIEVESIKLPVSSGRSIADVVEVSVMELTNRSLGYNTNQEFLERYDELAKGEKNND